MKKRAANRIEPMSRQSPRRRARARGGFTLLELILAVTLLATFVLPIIYVIGDSSVRTQRFALERKVRELAHKKLFDRIHYYETNDQGTFGEEADFEKDTYWNDTIATWTWEVFPPEMRGYGDQVLLEYRISVHVPQTIGEGVTAGGDSEAGTTYEYEVWSLPDERWYEEQQYLWESGQPSLLYGDPALGDAYGYGGYGQY